MAVFQAKRFREGLASARDAASRGDWAGAGAAYALALAAAPDRLDIHLEAGVAQVRAGDFPGAEARFRGVLARQPRHARAWHDLGNVLRAQDRPGEALACHQQARSLAPEEALFGVGEGLALHALGRDVEAEEAFRRALALQPGHGGALYNLGTLLALDLDRLPEAIACYRQATASHPGHAQAWFGLASALLGSGDLPGAALAFRGSLALQPQDPEAHFGLACALLGDGHWQAGWPEYEWRLKVASFRGRVYPGPRWDGSPLSGGRLFLYGEQGAGDFLQSCRFLPQVAERCGDVVVACPLLLRTLVAGLPGIGRVCVEGEALPPFQACLPMMSLPGVLGLTPETVPSAEGYLEADPTRVARWASQPALAGAAAGALKVGLCWQGNANYGQDHLRSIALARLEPLLGTEGCRFFSLQKGGGEEQLADLPQGRVVDFSGVLGHGEDAFSELAALIACLDLVVTVDSAVAHLAGALGKPTFLLLPFASDWRWLRERSDSVWYHALRLFRQRAPRNWDAPLAEAGEALRALLHGRQS
jgi:tetratricopeptide (TPR) repeat protein